MTRSASAPDPIRRRYDAILSSPWFPALFTVAITAIRSPFADLPVWDDQGLFFNGWLLLQGDFGVANIQWSPMILFISALIHIGLSDSPVWGFWLFHLLGHLSIAVGGYCLLTALNTPNRTAGPLAAGFSLLIHTFMHLIDFPFTHLFHTGIPLLIGAYALRLKPVSPTVLIGLALSAFLLRNEALLIVLIWGVAGALRRREASLPIWCRNFWGSIAIWSWLLLMLWIMSHDARNWQTGRLELAFRQKFFNYANITNQYEAYYPMTPESENLVIDRAFGKGAHNSNLLELAWLNPHAFFKFIEFNWSFLLNGDLFLYYWHRELSYVIEIAFAAGAIGLFAAAAWRRQSWVALLALTAVMKVPLLLVTMPRFRYFGDSAFIAIVCAWLLIFPKRGARIADAIVAVLIVLSVYTLAYRPIVRPFGETPNRDRVQFMVQAAQHLDFKGKRIAEIYPAFTQTFVTKDILQSIWATNSVFEVGGRYYSSTGQLCDYLLLEDDIQLPNHLKRWERDNQPLLRNSKFRLYRQQGQEAIDIAPGAGDYAVWLSDSYSDTDAIQGRIDRDDPPNPSVTIKWDFEQFDFPKNLTQDIWVEVEENGGGFELLGRPFQWQMPFLEWTTDSPLIDDAYRPGPRNGRAYRFRVVAQTAGDEPRLMPIDEPVRFEPYVTIHDSPGDRTDLSGGADIDSIDDRELIIAWRLPPQWTDPARVVDYHVYIRVNGAETLHYLGQTRSNASQQINWRAGDELVAPDFRGGPQFGESYEFYLFVVMADRGDDPDSPFRNAAPVRFVERGSSEAQRIPQITEFERPSFSAIHLSWRFPDDPVNGFDLYARERDTGEFRYLTRLGSDARRFLWTLNNEAVSQAFNSGPDTNTHYEFAVFPLYQDGRYASPLRFDN